MFFVRWFGIALLILAFGCDRKPRTCDEIFADFQPLWDCSQGANCPMSNDAYAELARLHRDWITCVNAKERGFLGTQDMHDHASHEAPSARGCRVTNGGEVTPQLLLLLWLCLSAVLFVSHDSRNRLWVSSSSNDPIERRDQD